MIASKRQIGNWQWIHPEDAKLPPEQQTVFTLSPMTQAERMESYDMGNWVRMVNGQRMIEPRAFRQAREICLSHVVDVANLRKEVPGGTELLNFPSNGTAEEKSAFFDSYVDEIILFHIANEIRDRSTIGPPEKN